MSATLSRRRFLLGAAGLGIGLARLPSAQAAPEARNSTPRTALLPPLPVRQVKSDFLNFGYHVAGPEDGRTIILLHDFFYDIHSYAGVAGLLATGDYRIVAPYLRGHGTTRFKEAATPRSGQLAALGSDVLALMDALHIPEAVIAGFGWGARAACAMAALRPTRCVGLVTAGGSLVDDPAEADGNLWSQYDLETEAGRAAVSTDRRKLAHRVWRDGSPDRRFDEVAFERTAPSFNNPDFAAVVIHAYRHRLGRAAGDPAYETAESKLSQRLPIGVPSIALLGDGAAAGPAADHATIFSGPHSSRRVAGAGRNLPFDAPQAFASAVTELARTGKWRT